MSHGAIWRHNSDNFILINYVNDFSIENRQGGVDATAQRKHTDDRDVDIMVMMISDHKLFSWSTLPNSIYIMMYIINNRHEREHHILTSVK